MLSSWLYVVGCFALLPGTILLLDQFSKYERSGIAWLIGACGLLFVAAIIDLEQAIRNRPAAPEPIHGDYSSLETAPRKPPALWPQWLLGPLCSLLGGLFFFVGALMYWPSIASDQFLGTTVANTGTWVFRVGSCCYLVGSLNFVRQWVKTRSKDYWAIAGTGGYMTGSSLYLSGGILNQLNKPHGSELWVGGSVAFAAGSVCFLYSAGICRR